MLAVIAALLSLTFVANRLDRLKVHSTQGGGQPSRADLTKDQPSGAALKTKPGATMQSLPPTEIVEGATPAGLANSGPGISATGRWLRALNSFEVSFRSAVGQMFDLDVLLATWGMLLGIAINWILYFAFDKWAWRWPRFRWMLPNLRGTWVGKVSSDVTSASGRMPPEFAVVRIRQTWSKMLLTLETEHSHSETEMAALSVERNLPPELSYEYRANPKEWKERRPHRGASHQTILFQERCRWSLLRWKRRWLANPVEMEGTYYTDAHGRFEGYEGQQIGSIRLRRLSRNPYSSFEYAWSEFRNTWPDAAHELESSVSAVAVTPREAPRATAALGIAPTVNDAIGAAQGSQRRTSADTRH